MASVRALIVEDDTKLASFLLRVLTEEGFSGDLCASGADALTQARTGLYRLMLLDWMLPDLDGLSVCRELRRAGNPLPILMLTARGEVRERVLGLEAGADDYLIKPFEVDELVARIHAVLRRTAGQYLVRVGELELDRFSRHVWLGGQPIELTNREYRFLLHVVQHAGNPVRRSELLSEVWELGFDPGSNLIEVLVNRLREKLGASSWMIETVRGYGYRLRTEPPA